MKFAEKVGKLFYIKEVRPFQVQYELELGDHSNLAKSLLTKFEVKKIS